MRAREPDIEGCIKRDDVEIGYEVFGEGTPTLLLLPTWTIIHSRFWKAQIPYLSRHFRVITFDRPGNGRSDRPLEPAAYTVDAVVGHALAIMDATATNQVVLVSLSQGAQEALKLAADHPDRVLGAVFIGASLTLEPGHPERVAAVDRFYEPSPPEVHRWERLNASTGSTTTRTSSSSSSRSASPSPTPPSSARTAKPGLASRHPKCFLPTCRPLCRRLPRSGGRAASRSRHWSSTAATTGSARPPEPKPSPKRPAASW